MGMLKRLTAPPEVRAILNVLDQAAQEYRTDAYKLVQKRLEASALENPTAVVAAIRDGVTPEIAVYSQIANVAGDLLESGKFHIHRGVLDPLDKVPAELLELHDSAVDELVRLGMIDSARASRQKQDLRGAIAQVG